MSQANANRRGEFDDPLVRNALERLAGYLPDEEIAYATIRSRARNVRQRRFGVATMACVGVLGVGMYSAGLRHSSEVVINQSQPVETTVAVVPTTAVATTVILTTVPVTTIPAIPTTVGGQLLDPVAGNVIDLEPIPTSTTIAIVESPPVTKARQPRSTNPPNPSPQPEPAPTNPTATNPPATNPPATNPPATGPPPSAATFSDSYSSGGGSVTVSSDGSSVTIVSAVAADGFTAKIDKANGSSVRVNFIGKNVTYRVKSKLSGGKIVFEVHKDDHPETTSTVVAESGGDQGGSENGSSDVGGARHSGDDHSSSSTSSDDGGDS